HIKNILDWAKRWIQDDTTIAEKLVAFIVFEGIFFAGSFISIYWLKTQTPVNASTDIPFMNGLFSSNDFISRDESLHCELGCLVFNHIEEDLRPSEEKVKQIISEGVDLAIKFNTDIIDVGLIGMNIDKMSDYIKFIANRYIRMI